MRQRRATLVVAAGVAGAIAVVAPSTAATAPGFTPPSRADNPAISAANGQKYVNEPATVVGGDGTRYVAYQRDSQLSTTRDGGRTWQYVGGPTAAGSSDVLTKNISGCTSVSDIGDVDLTVDKAGVVYFGDLQITAGGLADTGIQPVVAHSGDGFRTYSGTCAAHQVASVDREWLAAYTAPGKRRCRATST